MKTMPRQQFYAVIMACVFANGYAADCAKPLDNNEQLICGTPQLASLDDELNALYAQAIPAGARWHQRLHARWLAARSQCNTAACLATSYAARIAELDALKYLDWDNEGAFKDVLDITKEQGALIRSQQDWSRTLEDCGDFACVNHAYKQRNAALVSLRDTVVRAGMKKYVNAALGIGFDYLENRSVAPCEQADCVELKGAAMGEGSTSILEISVLKGNLAATAGSMWERKGSKWYATGRNAQASQVVPYNHGWKGLHATTMCGFHDRNGFHAAGECNTYLRSNGKRAIVVRDDGVSGKDEASLATIASIHFLR